MHLTYPHPITIIKKLRQTVLVAAIVTSSPLAATAEEQPQQSLATTTLATFAEDNGAKQRINLSGKLRMLSQRLVANACYVQSSVATEETTAALTGTIEEFIAIVTALENGNPEMGIFGAEERPKTLRGIRVLNEAWAPMQQLAETVASGQGSEQDVNDLSAQSVRLLDIAQRLVAEVSAQYTNPSEMRQADAMTIDLAGRQRMLAQRISKNVCLNASGINTETATAELLSASEAFGSSLSALYVGMPAMGIQPPPTEQIEEQLAQVQSDWTMLQELSNLSLEGGQLNDAQMTSMFRGANGLTGSMNAIVGMYATVSTPNT